MTGAPELSECGMHGPIYHVHICTAEPGHRERRDPHRCECGETWDVGAMTPQQLIDARKRGEFDR